ncbi:hypothetical protein GCM10027614_03760 [Micromonospora vulcania]
MTSPRVRAGRGQVSVDWDRVPDAVGYLVHRADGDGPYRVVDHRGGDLLAVPGPPYGDTTVEPGRTVRYAVRPVLDPDRPDDSPLGPPSAPVAARADGDGVVEVTIDAARALGPVHRPWRDMIGSEHLSLLLCTDRVGGEQMGAGLAAALGRVHRELGVERVRAHGILGDDLGVYREVDGEPVHDFAGIDAVLDALAPTGLRPVLELSFTPRALARDPSRVVTDAGVSSPPRDWDRWANLVGDLVRHLRHRVGDAELRRWAVEVWNEPDLDCFWTGSRDDYLRMYDVTARAVRAACPGLPVGGPATRRRSGSSRSSITSTPPAPRWTSSPHTSTAVRRWTCARRWPGTVGPVRHCSGPSGAPPHALRAGQRLGALGGLRGHRNAGGRRSGGGAGLLGGQRPLRGAGPTARTAARRVRAAVGRWAGETPVLGAVDAGATRPGATRRPARR